MSGDDVEHERVVWQQGEGRRPRRTVPGRRLGRGHSLPVWRVASHPPSTLVPGTWGLPFSSVQGREY